MNQTILIVIPILTCGLGVLIGFMFGYYKGCFDEANKPKKKIRLPDKPLLNLPGFKTQ